jgi:microcystin-dependent protein
MRDLLSLLVVLFIFSIFCYSDVPNEIRYSGRLKNYNSLVNAMVDFNFKIYNQESDGTAVWESGNQHIRVSSGVFSYVIKPDLKKVDLRKSNIWLQLVVDGRELSPREKLMAQFYSLHSLSAESLSSNDEILIKAGDSSVVITIKNGKLCCKSSQVANFETMSVPPGTIIAFAGNRIPEGYLLCDGSEVKRSRYPQLFEAIGTIYGGNASTRFKLPDLRGMFIRGVGGNAAPLGKQQSDAIRNITGSAWARGIEEKICNSWGVLNISSSPDTYSKGHSGGDNAEGAQINFDASRVVPVADENRPANCSVNYCIKY